MRFSVMSLLVAGSVGLAACVSSNGTNGASGSSPAPTPETDRSAAYRAGQGDFDATGRIPCRQTAAQPMGQCLFGVAREGPGTATVAVTWPDGRRRFLTFVDGEFLSADTSQADGYPEYGATREGDLSLVFVGEERYEVPDAVVDGG